MSLKRVLPLLFLNGQLVVEEAHTKRVLVEGVDVGYADVAVVAGAVEKSTLVWVDQDREVSVVVATFTAPARGGWLSSLLSGAVTIAYLTLR